MSEIGLFFDERSAVFLSKPRLDFRDLCYISGRDYRVWTAEVYNDLVDSIIRGLDASERSSILEVGCAAGFLAGGLSALVGRYSGVDISPISLKLARKQKLKNTEFKRGDATALPYPDEAFDATVCYDVFTNFSDLVFCRRIISEMGRVTKKGGSFMVGSIPDAVTEASYPQRVAEVSAKLPPFIEDPDIASKKWMPWTYRLYQRYYNWRMKEPPHIVCYYFPKDFFIETAGALGVQVEIQPVHTLNPYVGFRYNAVFRKS